MSAVDCQTLRFSVPDPARKLLYRARANAGEQDCECISYASS